MNVIRYNVNSTDACNIGYQYEHNASKVVFSGYAMKDPENEMYFKFMGRTAASRYLIPIVDMTLDITHLLTKNAGTFKCQLEERTAEGDFVGETPVFQVHVGTSIKSNADYEIVDDRLPTLYTKYNEMYNIIHRTNEQAVGNELERQANWETLRTEVRAAIADIDGSLDSYKAETTAELQSDLNSYKTATSNALSSDLDGYKSATDAALQAKFEEYAADSDDSIKDSFEDYKREANMNITNEVLAAKEGLQEDIDGKFSSTKAVYDLEIGAVVSDLERRRDNGDFNGKDGYTPVKGKDYRDGIDGTDYVITEADYQAIGDKVEAEYTPELTNVRESLNQKVGFTDYASSDKSGVVKTSGYYLLSKDADNRLIAMVDSYNGYISDNRNAFISKGTLENVLAIERSKLADTQNALLQAQRKIDLLYALNEGISYVWETDETEAHSKQIPSGAKQMGVEMIGGKSVVWNQLIRHTNKTITRTNSTFVFNENGTITVNSNGNSDDYASIIVDASKIKGHKLYMFGCPKGGGSGDGSYYLIGGSIFPFRDTGKGVIGVVGNSADEFNVSVDVQKIAIDNLTFKPRLIDLTQLYGAGNEPTSTDDPRIKAIEQYAEAHLEYNSGEIISSQTDEVSVRGKNLIDYEMLYPHIVNYSAIQPNGVRFYPKTGTGGWYVSGLNVDWNELIRISFHIKNISGTNFRLRVMYEDGEMAETPTYNTEEATITYSTESYANKGHGRIVELRGNWRDAGYFEISNLIITEGKPVVDYSPYIKNEYPTNFPTLNSAGGVYDYVDVDKGELHRRVGVVDDISTLHFDVVPYYSELTGNSVFAIKMPRDSKGYNSWATCEAMCVDSVAKPYDAKDLYVLWNNTSQTDLTVAFPNGTTMQNVIEHYSGMPLYYELAEEVVTPIELPTELTDAISVEGNGSITFVDHNGHNFIIPNRETYMVKVGEA